ncbi:MAG: social motility and stimulation tgl protein [Deltaproteobacteria bacterium]|nr:social motility and stimulation tgl protein [Deltaproteobacteria bacterium]
MFASEPRIRFIPAAREQVVSILASLNKPHIAVPGKAAQEVQGYILGVGNSAGTLTAFVYLWLSETREPVVYIDPERLRVAPAAYPEAESDAVAFVESMGFILENLNYRSLSPAQQEELVKSLPCFQPEPPSAAPGGDSRAVEKTDLPQVRLARFLAAF